MRFSEILNEGPPKGWLSLSDTEVEIHDYDDDHVEVTIEFGENGEYVAIDVDIEVDAREVDAGFGYEYGSISGYHDATDVEGGVNVTGYSVDEQHYKHGTEDLRLAARALRVPGRQSKNPHVVLKYLEHAWQGGAKGLLSDIDRYIQDHIADKIIDSYLESERENAELARYGL